MMEMALENEQGARGVDGELSKPWRSGGVEFWCALALLEASCTPTLGTAGSSYPGPVCLGSSEKGR